jgi:hypothetical protein
MTRILFWVALIALGVALYHGIDRLPASWQDWLQGKKTKLVAFAAIAGPEALDLVATLADAWPAIQELGVVEWLPSPAQRILMQAFGVAALVARLRTGKEQAA